MYDIEKLQIIHRFIIENEDKYKILATGDIDQLESFSNYGFNNVYDLKTYIINIIDLLFPNQVILKTIKRIDNEEDKIKLISLKNDLFNTSLHVMDIFKKYGLKIIDNIMHLKTVKNISYFKKRAEYINYYVHDNLIEQPEITYEFNNIKYWKGLEIICKEHYCNKNMLLHVNFSYTINEINIDENYFQL